MRAKQRILAFGPAVLVAGAIWQFLAENRRVHAPLDDAYIFYRYALNLVAGHGLVFNVGERVEGFTSLIWTLLVAAGVATGADAVAVGHWLGVGSGALLLWLTYQYAAFELAGVERFVAAIAPWLLLLSKPFAVWATSGLETPLFGAAVVAVLIAEARGRIALALLFSALAVLTRPEGVLMGAIVLGLSFYRRSVDRRRWLILSAGFTAFLVALTVFRLSYFGAPLPNTFYAKVGGAIPWWSPYYIASFLLPTLLPTLWPSVYAWRDRYLAAGFCWIAAIFAFVLAVGGDTFSNSRFFLPMLPVSCVIVARGALQAHRDGTAAGHFAVWGVAVCAVWFTFGSVIGGAAMIVAALQSWFGGPGVRRAGLAVVAVLLVAGSVMLAKSLRLPAKSEHQILADYSQLARTAGVPTRRFEQRESRFFWYFWSLALQRAAERVNARPPEDKLVAALGIGSLAYHLKGRVLDIVGLTDPVVARSRATTDDTIKLPGHQRSNVRYVLSKKPDYILLPERGEAFYQLPAVVELSEDHEFQLRYIWDPEVGMYRRRD